MLIITVHSLPLVKVAVNAAFLFYYWWLSLYVGNCEKQLCIVASANISYLVAMREWKLN